MKKILIIIGAAVALVAIVGFTIYQSKKNVIEVQTGKVAREDLTSVVSASGEIKPLTYTNVGALAMGQIVKLYVKEGDWVKKGQELAQVDNTQPGANAQAAQAALSAGKTDAQAAAAGYQTALADVDRAKAQADQAKFDYERAEGLYKQQLISKQDYDAKKAAWDAAASGLAQARIKIAQMKAQMDSQNERVHQAAAQLTAATDVLHKTTYRAPYDGLVSNLPVREGETVVMGIQNAPGSTLMTVADMSVITAEVMVDETDIVNIKMGQPAEVTVDALPKQIFHGHVTEIGNNALVRSTGTSTSQTTAGSQEAKDFKVVVTLDDPPKNLRPGLSTTAKITTASKMAVLAIPIQAVTVRTAEELKPKATSGSVQAAEQRSAADKKKDKEEKQGVFVLDKNKKVQFREVKTGISGTTDIEILDGLKEGDEIVTGSYRVLRTLKNGASVKVDNSTPAKTEDKS
jgi:HlyD family secretion protein